MAEESILLLKCPNADCGKQFKMRRPERGGVFKIGCPHCKQAFKVNIPAPKAQETAADNSAKAPIKIDGEFTVGNKYEVTCPHCKNIKLGYTPPKEGVTGFRCPKCKGMIAVEAKQPAKPTKAVDNDNDINMIRGRIKVQKLLGKKYPLRDGVTTIGRYDDERPSDISLKGDSFISRRSVEIDTRMGENGYTFKLNVINATNAVLLNGSALKPGDSVYLNFGDIITLGKTRLRFEKDM